jgi:hypothetical protein
LEKKTMMAHGTADVAAVEDPVEGFGESVRRVVDRSGDVSQYDITLFFPLLDGKMLNRNMPGASCRLGGVDHENRGLIVLIQHGGAVLLETELGKDQS